MAGASAPLPAPMVLDRAHDQQCHRAAGRGPQQGRVCWEGVLQGPGLGQGSRPWRAGGGRLAQQLQDGVRRWAASRARGCCHNMYHKAVPSNIHFGGVVRRSLLSGLLRTHHQPVPFQSAGCACISSTSNQYCPTGCIISEERLKECNRGEVEAAHAVLCSAAPQALRRACVQLWLLETLQLNSCCALPSAERPSKPRHGYFGRNEGSVNAMPAPLTSSGT